MIFEGSRYQNSLVLTVTAADGATRPTIYSAVPFPPQVSFLYHTVKPHDRLDSLAALYYRNPELWWVIANANPEVFYPDSLDPGTIIRIPQGTG